MKAFMAKDGMMKLTSPYKISQSRTAKRRLTGYECDGENPISLLLIGIRDLKQINERLGRKVGDTLIKEVGFLIADIMSEFGDGNCMISRMAGREYLVTLNKSMPSAQLGDVAKKILTGLEADFVIADERLKISARIGIASAENSEQGLELLHRAQSALSDAYARKGKKFAFSEFKTSIKAEHSALVDSALRDAIMQRQITIVFQPQFDVATGRLVGVEALARLQHAQLGEVGASQLFASADRCDLREELSAVIQEAAITIAASWPAALDDLRLAINLGAEELGEGYSSRLMAVLSRIGFAPGRLTLELTEESLVRDIALAAEELERLRVQGIRIAVDDFGTGYSSLAYLKDLPLDYLKIDKSMTPDISGTGKDRIVLRAIIAMGKALDLKIIAEGVELEEELAMLKAEECDFYQGFLRSKPLSPEKFERFAMRSN
jgi:diguanylate cyclase